jgi:hypothetical protein
MSIADYKSKYNVQSVHSMSGTQKEKLSKLWADRMKDPYWISKMNENRKSIFDYKYWMGCGMDEISAKERVRTIQSSNSKKRNYDISPTSFSVEFWKRRGLDDSLARDMVGQIQRKLSSRSPKFSGRHHSTESKHRISEGLRRHIDNVGNDVWISHFGDSADSIYRSNGEIELYNNIISSITDSAIANTFIGHYNVDILIDNIVIEYFGIYWHCHPNIFNELDIHPHIRKTAKEIWEYDYTKIKYLEGLGYTVIVVWENEYNDDKNEILKKIKNIVDGNSH